MNDILINNIPQDNYSEFKIIVADTDLDIFEEIKKIKENFCFINLNSEYAINFVMEYEKIDLALVSMNIPNIEKIIDRAKRRKIKLLIVEKDLPKNFDSKHIRKIFIREFENKKSTSKPKESKEIKGLLNRMFKTNRETINIKNSTDNSTSSSLMRSENEVEIKLKDNKKIINTKNMHMNNIENEIKYDDLIVKKKNKKDKEEKIRAVKQKILAVLRVKGGVGSTTITYFIATLLNNIKTLIIDLNFSEGCSDLGYYLNTSKTPNLTFFSENCDKNSFESSLININKNLDIILPPPSHEISDRIDLKEIYTLVDIARKKYDLMIFDLPNKIDEFYLGITDIIDILILISDESLGSLGRMTEVVSKYIYDGLEKIFIVNKIKNFKNINPNIEIIKNYLKINCFLFIPYFKELDSILDLKQSYFENLDGFENLKETTLKMLTS